MIRKTKAQRRGRATLLAMVLVLSTIAFTAPVAGTTAVDGDTYDDGPTYAGEEIADVWIGQEITLVDDGTFDGEFVSIVKGPEPTDNSPDPAVTAEYNESENAVTFETDALEAGEIYHIYAHGDNFEYHGDAFRAMSEDLDTEFRSDTVAADSTVSLEVESERDDQHLNVTADGLDAGELEMIFGAEHAHPTGTDEAILLQNVGADDTFEANFEDIPMDEYEFTFDVSDSNARDTTTITVREDNEDYSFVDVDQPEQGDIANITLEVTDSDSAAVVLGNQEDNFQSSVELEDVEDERVVLQFNTHLAATGDAWSVHEDSNASIEDVNVQTLLEEGEAFPAHRWDLSVGDEVDSFELENEFDRDVLYVQRRSAVGEASIRTAPAAADISDRESFREATVTRTDTVAEADALILTVEDFGAEGAITTLEDGSALADDGLVVEIEEQNPGPVAEPHVWNSSADGESDVDPLEVELLNAGVDADQYEGDLHFLVTYESDSYDRNLAVGDSYDVTFSVTDANAYVDDGEEIERELDLELVERELTWDPIQTVPPTENATATGSTTVAPGTELRATADSPVEEGGFVQMTDVVVEEGTDGNHQFAATFDFSVTEPDVSFDLIVEDSYDPDENYDVLETVEFTNVVTDPPSAFEVSARVPATAAVGDDAALEVTVENVADEAGTTNYSVVVGGERVDEDELSLDAGEAVERRYEFDTSAAGELGWEVTTDDDEAAGTLIVQADAASGDENGADETVTEDADEADGGSDEDGTPGFGVAVTAVALLVAAALAARRDR